MKKTFVDADAFVSLVRTKDKNHLRAKKIYEYLKRKETVFFSSNTSLYETVTVISQRVSHKKAKEFFLKVRQGLNVVFVNQEREKKAVAIFNKQTSKNVSFFDCLNMAIMRELGIKQVFSFDKHYKKNGFLRIGIDIAPRELKE